MEYLTKETWLTKNGNTLYPTEYQYNEEGDIVITTFSLLDEDGYELDYQIVYD